MKNLKLVFFIFCCFLNFGCGDDEGPVVECTNNQVPDYALIDVITGMDYFDFNGSQIGRFGVPNHNPGQIMAYPIPSTGEIFIASPQKIKQIWLVPASCIVDSTTIDLLSIAKNLNYSLAEIESVQIKTFETPDFNNQISLDFSAAAKGIYRLFYQMDDAALFWHNLYIDPGVNNFPSYDFLDDFCN